MDLLLLAPFLIGLASALHCVGMCGGIIGALSISLPPEARAQRGRLFAYTAAYSAGRIASYALAGALMGGLGGRVFGALSPEYGHTVLRVLAALLLVGVGLYLAGWFPKFAQLERLGQPLWQRLEPLGQRLLPVRSLPRALGFGLVWGWLPCGLVYSTLLWASSSGSAGRGALYMAAFGAGTLPAVVTAGLLTGAMTRLLRQASTRALIGASLIAFGVASLWFAPGHEHAAPPTAASHEGHRHEVPAADTLSDGAVQADAPARH